MPDNWQYDARIADAMERIARALDEMAKPRMVVPKEKAPDKGACDHSQGEYSRLGKIWLCCGAR